MQLLFILAKIIAINNYNFWVMGSSLVVSCSQSDRNSNHANLAGKDPRSASDKTRE